jgi:AbiU2
VIALQPILDSIRKRRDAWLAHLDPQTVSDPTALAAKAKLSIPDLDRALKDTEEIVVGMSSLYQGVIGELHFLGDDDYKSALNWIRRAECAFIENYEIELGPWTGPRPKDCSRKPYDPLSRASFRVRIPSGSRRIWFVTISQTEDYQAYQNQQDKHGRHVCEPSTAGSPIVPDIKATKVSPVQSRPRSHIAIS